MRPSARLASSVRPSAIPSPPSAPASRNPLTTTVGTGLAPPGGPRGGRRRRRLALGAQARAGLDPEVAQLRQGQAALLLGLALPAGVLQRPDQRAVVRLLLGRDLDQPERLRHRALAAGVERDQPPPEPHLDPAQAFALGDAPGAELEGVRQVEVVEKAAAAEAGQLLELVLGQRLERGGAGRREDAGVDLEAAEIEAHLAAVGLHPGARRRRRRAPGSCSATSAARPWGRRGPARRSRRASRAGAAGPTWRAAPGARGSCATAAGPGGPRRGPPPCRRAGAGSASGGIRGRGGAHGAIIPRSARRLPRSPPGFRNAAEAPQPGRAPDRANSAMSSA